MLLSASPPCSQTTSRPDDVARLSSLESTCVSNLRCASKQLVTSPGLKRKVRSHPQRTQVTCILDFFRSNSSAIDERLAYPRWDMVFLHTHLRTSSCCQPLEAAGDVHIATYCEIRSSDEAELIVVMMAEQ